MHLSSFSPSRILVAGLITGIVVCVLLAGFYNLTGNSRFCGGCHSMQAISVAWQASTHKQFACVECHLPDTHVIGRVAYKLAVGARDITDETLGTYARPITISYSGAGTVNQNCLRCHFSVMEKTALSGAESNCVNCHRFLVHGQFLKRRVEP